MYFFIIIIIDDGGGILRSCIAYRGSIKPQDNSGLNQNNLKRRGTNVGVKPKFRHLYMCQAELGLAL
jgi:hypothetical protein